MVIFCWGIRESPLSTSPRWSIRARALLRVRALLPARTKCSLRVDSLTLHRGESSTTAHKLDMSHPQELWVIFMPPITTKLSRWWGSLRVTSKEFSLDPNKALESGGCTLELLELSREGFSQEITQFSILSRLLLLFCTTRCFLAEQMGKWALLNEVEEYKYSPSSPRASQMNSTENVYTGQT